MELVKSCQGNWFCPEYHPERSRNSGLFPSLFQRAQRYVSTQSLHLRFACLSAHIHCS